MNEERRQWFEEQAEAASAEARTRVLGLAARFGQRAHVVEQPTDTGPLEELINEFMDETALGHVMCCEHLETPRPTWVILAERPRRVRCEQCHSDAMAFGLGSSPVCDLCGEETPTHHGIVTTDFLVVTFNCCQGCRYDT